MLKNFLKHLSVWVINIFIVLMLSTSFAHSQECEYVYNDEGVKIERALSIDGEVHMYFPMEAAREMQKPLEKIKKKETEISLLEEKNSLLKMDNEFKSGQIKFLESSLQYSEDLSMKALDSGYENRTIWQDPAFNFISGVVLTATSFAVWEYTRNVNQE